MDKSQNNHAGGKKLDQKKSIHFILGHANKYKGKQIVVAWGEVGHFQEISGG